MNDLTLTGPSYASLGLSDLGFYKNPEMVSSVNTEDAYLIRNANLVSAKYINKILPHPEFSKNKILK